MSAAADWQTFKNDEGKPYYFNSVTKETVWDKPDVLKSNAERAADACLWKAVVTADNRTYYYNSETKATVWETPAEYQQVLDLQQAEAAAASAAAAAATAASTDAPVANASSNNAASAAPKLYDPLLGDDDDDDDDGVPSSNKNAANSASNVSNVNAVNSNPLVMLPVVHAPPLFNAPTIVPAATATTTAAAAVGVLGAGVVLPPPVALTGANSVAPTLVPMQPPTKMLGRMNVDGPPPSTPAEVFKRLLNDAGVPGHAVWDTALRAVINDPRYACINSIVEKRRLFDEYVVEQRARERRDFIANKQKLQDNFNAMLKRVNAGKNEGQINEWRQIMVICADDAAFNAVEESDERKFFFEEYIFAQQRAEFEEQAAARKAAMRAYTEAVIALAYTEAGQSPPPADAPTAANATATTTTATATTTATTTSTTTSTTSASTTNASDVAPPQPLSFRTIQSKLTNVGETLNWQEKLTAHDAAVAELDRRRAVFERAQRDAQRERERIARAAFRELLRNASSGRTAIAFKFSLRATWAQFVAAFRNEPALINMRGASGSQAAELFDDFLEERRKHYDREFATPLRKQLRALQARGEAANDAEEGEAEIDEAMKRQFAVDVSLRARCDDTASSYLARVEAAGAMPTLMITDDRVFIEEAVEEFLDKHVEDVTHRFADALVKASRATKQRDYAALVAADPKIKALASLLCDDERAARIAKRTLVHESRSRSRSRSRSSSSSDDGDRKRRHKHKHKKRGSSSERSDDDRDSRSKKTVDYAFEDDDDDKRDKKRSKRDESSDDERRKKSKSSRR